MSKVKFGLSKVAVALRNESTSLEGVTTVTYGAPVAIPGAVNLSLDRNSDENKFYADNIAYFSAYAKSGFSGDLEVADLPRKILKDFLGYAEAEAGGILETNTASTPKFALLFQVETDAKARKFCIFNCTAAESNEEYATTEESIDPKTSTLSITGSGEDVDGVQVFRQIVEEGDENYANFFQTVTVPAFKS